MDELDRKSDYLQGIYLSPYTDNLQWNCTPCWKIYERECNFYHSQLELPFCDLASTACHESEKCLHQLVGSSWWHCCCTSWVKFLLGLTSQYCLGRWAEVTVFELQIIKYCTNFSTTDICRNLRHWVVLCFTAFAKRYVSCWYKNQVTPPSGIDMT